MRTGLRALNVLSGSALLDRVGLRDQVENALYRVSRDGMKAAATAGRTFSDIQKIGRPARQKTRSGKGLFDLTPDSEQQMMQEVMSQFATEQLRPAAQDADASCTAPAEILEQSVELGTPMLGVPEELGGIIEERSATTTCLVAESLAHGDLGLAVAALAPSAVATAIGIWGDTDQQGRYLPSFAGEDVPAAALALHEARPLFDPLEPGATATREGDGYVLSGVKALVPRARDAELFIVSANLQDTGPALFIVESRLDGITVADDPAMGVRAAGTGKVEFSDVKLEVGALLGGGDPEVIRDCVLRSRLAWCALAVGCAQAVLDEVKPYVTERKAFGEPIGHRQAVAFTVSNIAIELEGMRLTTYRAASLADQGKPFAFEVAMAHRLCTAKGMQIGSDGVQLYGGHGYTKEYPLERWYRDLRAIGSVEGGVLA
ncbi:MAG: acyl-CoA dehydrogenase family protein [Solirubrobacterales bacterium]